MRDNVQIQLMENGRFGQNGAIARRCAAMKSAENECDNENVRIQNLNSAEATVKANLPKRSFAVKSHVPMDAISPL